MTDTKPQTQYGPLAMTRLELRGIRCAVDGGDGSGAGGGNATGGENSGGQQATGGEQQGAAQQGNGQQQQQADGQKPADQQQQGRQYTAEETQRHIAKLNQENQAQRQRADAAEARSNAILKAAGFNPDGSTAQPEPEEVAKTLAERERELADARRERAVLLAAPASQADASKLLDSMTFRTALGKLDAGDSAGITKLVNDTIEGNPAYKLAPPAAASSGGQRHQGDSKATGARRNRQDAFRAEYGRGQQQ